MDEEIEGADDKAVTKEVLDELERFLFFANVIYEAGNDKTLARLLTDKGMTLLPQHCTASLQYMLESTYHHAHS